MKTIARGAIQLEASQEQQETYTQEYNGVAFIYDTETTTTLPQLAKVAFGYLLDVQKNIEGKPQDIIITRKVAACFDLLPEEYVALQNFCKSTNHKLLTSNQFRNLLFQLASKGVAIIGHNVPFDLGAICTDFEVDENLKAFRLKLCECGETEKSTFINKAPRIKAPCTLHPCVVIKQVKSKKSIMYFEHNNYAPIVDTITFGNACLGAGASSLDAMLTRYGMEEEKKNTVDYDAVYDEDMFVYAAKDVELTCKLFIAEYQLFKKHGVNKPFYNLMSEASLGKAYEEKFNIPPFKVAHTEIKPFLYALANYGYAGGINEAHIRRTPVLIRYCDFKSQYPLVNALLDTQRFYLTEYIHVTRDVEYAQRFLDSITLESLFNKSTWKKFFILVKIACNNDLLPDKGIDDTGVKSFGLKIVKDGEKWCSIIDAVRSKLHTGVSPKIIDAFILTPSSRKINTNTVALFGDDRFSIDLSKQDLYTTVIDLRDDVKKQMKGLADKDDEASKQEYNFLSNLQLALKLLANSSSYGIRVETREVNREDVAGKYNAMPVGIHITSGGRLLLGIADCLGKQYGLEHAMCDTDSFAYAKPDNMNKEDFYKAVDAIVARFKPLSPYRGEGAIFELEDVNFYNKQACDLYAYCISTKRYCLFNITPEGKPRIRKFTEHGLTSYVTDRNIVLPPDVLPPLIKYWRKERYMMWYRALELALAGEAPRVIQDEEWSMQYAFKQATISTPNVYNQYKHIGVRPFSFMCVTPHHSQNKKIKRVYFPLATNKTTLENYIQKGYIRYIESNEVCSTPNFETIGSKYATFFEHGEAKFANGSEDGVMKRRVVSAQNVEMRTRSGKKISSTKQLELF